MRPEYSVSDSTLIGVNQNGTILSRDPSELVSIINNINGGVTVSG